ncbi:MAG: hypothetical protein IID45_12990 [Planctomycetes bacterium]|nr:hypothetical protein [Planctomycetota bacterium]
MSDAALSFPARSLIATSASLRGFWLTHYMDSLKLPAKLLLVRRIRKLMRAGVLTTDVGKRFTLQNIHAAVLEAESVGRQGKVILEIADGESGSASR